MDLHKLISQMTVEEKLGQMFQLVSFGYLSDKKTKETGAEGGLVVTHDEIAALGSVLNFYDAADVIRIQKQHLENDRNKIPLLFMLDVVHGFKTIFPIPLALGATFDPELVKHLASMSAAEASVSGVNVTFSPMADLCRDARWGRVMESTGEDAFLNSLMARAFVEGYQGDFSVYNIAACVKHFACYGAAVAGKEYAEVDMSDHTLYQDYLPAYHAAVDAGVAMVMSAFNTLNGIPCSANGELFSDILRDSWGFDGVVISDYSAVAELVEHGVASNGQEAAELAFGIVDIDMMSLAFIRNGKKLIEEGKISEKTIDRSVFKILKLKERLGLFENPYRNADPQKEKELQLCKKHRELARVAAERSFVLLKNNGILPLSVSDRIALIGPFVNDGTVTGAWSCHGRRIDTITVAEGMKNKSCVRIEIAEGCGSGLFDTDDAGFEKALYAAEKAEKLVLCIGESSEMSGESKSRQNLEIPTIQKRLICELKKQNKPMVAVVFGGRPLILEEIVPYFDAVLFVFMPGTEAGNAIANVLYGEVNPSGKLPMSFPRNVGQLPLYYNHLNSGRPKKRDDSVFEIFTSSYYEGANEPLYPFGYGLSYTVFEYGVPWLSDNVMTADQNITLYISIANVGRFEGTETILLFIRDEVASVARPVKELKSFQKVFLKPGEKKVVEFNICIDMLKFYDKKNRFIYEPGDFTVYIGAHSCKFSLVDKR